MKLRFYLLCSIAVARKLINPADLKTLIENAGSAVLLDDDGTVIRAVGRNPARMHDDFQYTDEGGDFSIYSKSQSSVTVTEEDIQILNHYMDLSEQNGMLRLTPDSVKFFKYKPQEI